MAARSVPVKTPEAVAELGSRQRRLSQRHRTVLLLVDGKRSEGQVRRMALQAGAAECCFDELVELGMIELTVSDADPPASAPMPLAEVPAPQQAAPKGPLAGPDSVVSLLPPSLTLVPESSLIDSKIQELPNGNREALQVLPGEGQDVAFEEARDLMMRAVRAEAPVAGSLTLLRLRRARTRSDLEALLEEVELRITKPFKGLWATQTMSHVREILSTQTVT
jgi:hypothetical protein